MTNPHGTTTVKLTPAQARDIARDQSRHDADRAPFYLAPDAGYVVGLTFTTSTPQRTIDELRTRAEQLNPGRAQAFLIVARKLEDAAQA